MPFPSVYSILNYKTFIIANSHLRMLFVCKVSSSSQHAAECCSVLQCVTVCCSVLQCVAACCSVLQCVGTVLQSLKFLSTCCRVLHCVAVCYSVLQCVAVCCSVLQCVGTVLQSLKFLSTFPRGERHLGKRVLLALQAATIRPAKSHPSTRELDAESDQDCREDGPTLCSRPLSSYHLHSPLRLPPALKDGV